MAIMVKRVYSLRHFARCLAVQAMKAVHAELAKLIWAPYREDPALGGQ